MILFMTYLDEENDRRVFETIYYAYRKQMFVLAKSILQNQEDAEDAVSSVFLRVASKHWDLIRNIRSDKDLRNYLLKATKNTALNMMNSKKKKKMSLDTIQEWQVDGMENLSDDKFVERICNKVQYDQVIEAIRMLDEKYRDVLYYHFVLEWKVPDVAKILGQSVSTTKKQLVRGKKLLLDKLNPKGECKNEY